MRKTVNVFTASMAKELLKLGYQIIDLKKDKYDEDGKKTIFIFRNDDGLEAVINRMIKK